MSNKKGTSTENMQRYYEKKADREEQDQVTDENLSLQIAAKVQVKVVTRRLP